MTPKFVISTMVALALIAPNISQAQTSQESLQAQLIALVERLQTLLVLSETREQFYNNTQPDIEVDAETAQYFFVRVAESSDDVIFGDKAAELIIETDGGVTQLLLTTICRNSYVRTKNTVGCKTDNWIINGKEKDGVKTFTVDLEAVTNAVTDEFDLTVYACRFNGCVEETVVTLEYKEESTFADKVEIFDRWEWAYEWDEEIYHVQEVLLNFPYKEVKQINLRVRCDGHGLYIDVDDADDRTTCNSRRRFSQPDYRSYENDEAGNTYNLRVESVTDDIQEDEVGFVEMEFDFIGYKNQVLATVYHRPEQLDTLPEETEEQEG